MRGQRSKLWGGVVWLPGALPSYLATAVASRHTHNLQLLLPFSNHTHNTHMCAAHLLQRLEHWGGEAASAVACLGCPIIISCQQHLDSHQSFPPLGKVDLQRRAGGQAQVSGQTKAHR